MYASVSVASSVDALLDATLEVFAHDGRVAAVPGRVAAVPGRDTGKVSTHEGREAAVPGRDGVVSTYGGHSTAVPRRDTGVASANEGRLAAVAGVGSANEGRLAAVAGVMSISDGRAVPSGVGSTDATDARLGERAVPGRTLSTDRALDGRRHGGGSIVCIDARRDTPAAAGTVPATALLGGGVDDGGMKTITSCDGGTCCEHRGTRLTAYEART